MTAKALSCRECGERYPLEALYVCERCFGPLEVTKVGSEGYGTNLVVLKTLDGKGNVVLEDHRLALENKANQLWHTDSSFKRVPALASVLSSRVIPGRGGETEYVSTRLAFERLKRRLARETAHAAATLHNAHVFHKDF